MKKFVGITFFLTVFVLISLVVIEKVNSARQRDKLCDAFSANQPIRLENCDWSGERAIHSRTADARLRRYRRIDHASIHRAQIEHEDRTTECFWGLLKKCLKQDFGLKFDDYTSAFPDGGYDYQLVEKT